VLIYDDAALFSQIDMQTNCLNQMNVDDIVESLDTLDGLNQQFIGVYAENIKEKNINGKVLSCCDLDELKIELNMTFGDWQLFKNWLKHQRYLQIVKINREKIQFSKPSNKLTTKLLNNNLNNRLQNESKPDVPEVFTHLFNKNTSTLKNISNSKLVDKHDLSDYFETSDSQCPLLKRDKSIESKLKNGCLNDNAKKVDFFINASDSMNIDSNQTTISSIATANINYLFDGTKNKDDFDLSNEFTSNNNNNKDEDDVALINDVSKIRRNDSYLTNSDSIEMKPLLGIQNSKIF
jgi:hypothetical protein